MCPAVKINQIKNDVRDVLSCSQSPLDPVEVAKRLKASYNTYSRIQRTALVPKIKIIMEEMAISNISTKSSTSKTQTTLRTKRSRSSPNSRAATPENSTSSTTSSNSEPPSSSNSPHSYISSRRFSDIGGLSPIISQLQSLIISPLVYPGQFQKNVNFFGRIPSLSVLLHGPHGCGKTLIANALVGELNLSHISCFKCTPSSALATSPESSDTTLAAIFKDALREAPSLIFIDDLDFSKSVRESSRIVGPLSTLIQETFESYHASYTSGKTPRPVFVVASSSYPDAIPPSLRSLFHEEILIKVPTLTDRIEIFKLLTHGLPIPNDLNLRRISKMIPGYVGTDISNLIRNASEIAHSRYIAQGGTSFSGPNSKFTTGKGKLPFSQEEEEEDFSHSSSTIIDLTSNSNSNIGNSNIQSNSGPYGNEPNTLTQIPKRSNSSFHSKVQPLNPLENDQNQEHIDPLHHSYSKPNSIPQILPDLGASPSFILEDFTSAIEITKPIALREGFTTVPNVTWDDIGGLDEIRTILTNRLVRRIQYPEIFQSHGVSSGFGALFYGPPGCGKTLIAQAVANQADANFISVKGPEILSKFVGDSEKAVRQIFTRARASSPCIIFFDEIDALAPRRGGDSASPVADRVVTQLLTALDGLDPRGNVYVLGATNRLDVIDEALLRPGRFELKLSIPLPDATARLSILSTLVSKIPHTPFDLSEISSHSICESFSGADLASLVRAASDYAIQEAVELLDKSALDSFTTGHFDPLAFGKCNTTREHFIRALHATK